MDLLRHFRALPERMTEEGTEGVRITLKAPRSLQKG